MLELLLHVAPVRAPATPVQGHAAQGPTAVYGKITSLPVRNTVMVLEVAVVVHVTIAIMM